MIIIELNTFFDKQAKLSDVEKYIEKAVQLAGKGNEVTITGSAPVWLYLKVAHALHGKVKKLIYNSPVSGDITIFDHDPF